MGYFDLLRFTYKNTEERLSHALTQELMKTLLFVINYRNSTILVGNPRVRTNFCFTVVRRKEVRH